MLKRLQHLSNFTVAFCVMLMTGSTMIIPWLGIEQLRFKGQRGTLFSNIDRQSGNGGLGAMAGRRCHICSSPEKHALMLPSSILDKVYTEVINATRGTHRRLLLAVAFTGESL
jgi:hypothetical protein